MSSATSPLLKMFRDHPDQRSGPSRKVIGITPGSGSKRNADRQQHGKSGKSFLSKGRRWRYGLLVWSTEGGTNPRVLKVFKLCLRSHKAHQCGNSIASWVGSCRRLSSG